MVIMPRYAAIDIGSNSIRLMVADAAVSGNGRQPKLTTLLADRSVIRLGSSVFQQGRLSHEAIDLACANLTRMAEAYRKLDVVGVRIVATAAVRDASNQHEFVERATAAAGTPVEIISGQEEARLIHAGVQVRWPHPKQRVLIIDVGGGSAETIISESGRLVSALSKPLGAVRLTEVLLKNDPPTEPELRRLFKYIDERLSGAVAKIDGEFDRVIATSATAAAIVCAINRVPRARREQADRLRATTPQVRKFFEELKTRNLAERRKHGGIGPRRAEIIVAGAAVFLRSLELFHHSSMYYLGAGVRDGIIADLAARGVGRNVTHLSQEQKRVVEEMARRYGVGLKHARAVGSLAVDLFESLRPLHHLPASYGKLLEAAAYLHDVGHFISDTGHHKHSAYIVMNSDLPGFTDEERQLLALLCRFHRKAMPAARHSAYQSLGADARKSLSLMIPVLRIADNLDRGHQQRVESVDCQMKNGTIVVGIRAKGDVELEQWAAERVGDIFRQAYNVPLVVTRAKGDAA